LRGIRLHAAIAEQIGTDGAAKVQGPLIFRAREQLTRKAEQNIADNVGEGRKGEVGGEFAEGAVRRGGFGFGDCRFDVRVCVFVAAFGCSSRFRGVRGLKVCLVCSVCVAVFRKREGGDKEAAPRFDLEIALIEKRRVGTPDRREA